MSRATTFFERALDNDYAQERAREAAVNARAAYQRVSGRKAAQAAADKKLHRQLQRTAASLVEATNAVRSGRSKPKRRLAKPLIAAAAIAAAIALATKARLRDGVGAASDAGPAAGPDSS